MNVQEFKDILEKADDKSEVFTNPEIIRQCADFKLKELFDIMNHYLSDEEKWKVCICPIYQKFKEEIIKFISNEDIKLQMLNDDRVVNDLESFQLTSIIGTLGDEKKQQVLYNQEFIEKHEFKAFQLRGIISSLEDEIEGKILADSELIVNKLKIPESGIEDLIKKLSSEELKNNVLEKYQLNNYTRERIIATFSDEGIIRKVLEGNLEQDSKIKLLTLLETEKLGEFLRDNKEFYMENDISPYEITSKLDAEKQKEFVKKLEDSNLTLSEKKEILVTLQEEVKENIDITDFPEKLKSVMSMKIENGRVVLDLDRDLEDYRGLDNLMRICPEEFTKEQRGKMMELCDICPNFGVMNYFEGLYIASTAKEYKEGEEWVESVFDNLKPEYSQAQKLAVIDNAIGKRISYSPDFDTEVFDKWDCRALWKIISSGYGVCNGIANVERYMLDRAGIESELVDGKKHTFLKVKNIELPLSNGEVVKGNTIVDPTWGLTEHRFGALPDTFCVNYEQVRELDIDSEGDDSECHLNDEKLQDVIGLDEKSLRQLFTSVGVADKDGKFPITNLLEKSKLLHEFFVNQPNQDINAQFSLLSAACPEFATCQNSSMKILSQLLDHENLKFDKCVIKRVFDKEEKEKKPYIYIYIDSKEMGKKFYYADKKEGQLVELSQEKFVERFDCYENDLKDMEGIRPWETKRQEKEKINLAASSGRMAAEEGR